MSLLLISLSYVSNNKLTSKLLKNVKSLRFSKEDVEIITEYGVLKAIPLSDVEDLTIINHNDITIDKNRLYH